MKANEVDQIAKAKSDKTLVKGTTRYRLLGGEIHYRNKESQPWEKCTNKQLTEIIKQGKSIHNLPGIVYQNIELNSKKIKLSKSNKKTKQMLERESSQK